jgi:alpha-ketoglutarate-dependent taurine dioxygenase
MSFPPPNPSLKPGLAGEAPRRKAVSLSTASMVRFGSLAPGQTLPLVIEPALDELDPVAWAQNNFEFIGQKLVEHGAVLFRGFRLRTAEDFERFSRALIPHRVNYVEGSSPRLSLGEKIYTSTEYPADQFVSMHNELSYAHRWPGRLLFFCDVEPQQGGETPIADSRKVLALLPPELRRRFADKGVSYMRNLHGGRGAGLSWQTVFETEDRAAVESYCREGGIEFRWKEDGGMWTRQHRPAVRAHPATGEEVWFNQVDQWHPSNLEKDVARVLLASCKESDLPIYATYGDDTPFADSELDEVRQAFRQAIVKFPWRRGDALLVDNMLTAHGRMPFVGPRRVLVAMGNATA